MHVEDMDEHGHDNHHQHLHEEAHFVGPPEEDPILETFVCPFRTYHKERHEASEHPADLAFLKEVVHHNEHDPAILWFGLFTDLIFVAVIVKFANQFKYFYKYKAPEYYGADKDAFYIRILAETSLFFFAFFTVWLELVQANTRFCNLKGALDDVLYVTYLIGIIVMALQMDEDDFLMENKNAFIVGILLCFTAMFFLHVQYHQAIPRAKDYAERRLATYAVAGVILLIALIIGLVSDPGDSDSFATWFCAFAIVIGCGIVLGVATISFRVDPRYHNFTLEYFSERFGILIMIVTGESILALMVGDKGGSYVYTTDSAGYSVLKYNSYYYPIYENKGAFLQYGGSSNIDDYIAVGVAFLTMYVIKNLYFESLAEEHEHALVEEGHPGSVIWVLCHMPLAASLLGAGIGYKLVFTSLHDDTTPHAYTLFLGVSLCIAILMMLLIRASHDKFIFPVQSMCIRIPTALLIPLGTLYVDNALNYMYWCAGFVVLSWIFDLTIMEHLEVKKPHEDEAAHMDHKDGQNDGACGAIADICGFVDKEYQGAFHGPIHEGDPRQLITDILTGRIWKEPAPAPADFGDYIKVISQSHDDGHGGHGDGGGHGHGEVDESEAGQDHGFFGEFTDLIFVAIIIKFADQMKYKQSSMNQEDDELIITDWEHARIYLEAALYFVAFFVCWLELTHLLIRFRNMPGIFDDVCHFFYLFGVVAMGIQMNHLEYLLLRRKAFCCWFAFCMFVLVILHLKFYQIDDAEEYCRLRMVTFTCTGLLAIIGGFLSEISCTILLLLGFSIALFISLNSFRVWAESVPNPHIDFEYTERFGLIVMITTGESILALILNNFDSLEFEEYAAVIIAFLTMYVVKLIYFASHSEEPVCHALAEGNIPGSVMWCFMHMPAAYFLTCCGLGYKMILPYVRDDTVEKMARLTLGFSLAGVLVCFLIIRASHNKFTLPIASIFIRLPTIALAPAAGFYIEGPLAYIVWCCCICIVCYSLDMLLIDQLKFELDLDFLETLHAQKKKKSDKIKHIRRPSGNDASKASMGHDEGIELAKRLHEEEHDVHQHSKHGHHDTHDGHHGHDSHGRHGGHHGHDSHHGHHNRGHGNSDHHGSHHAPRDHHKDSRHHDSRHHDSHHHDSHHNQQSHHDNHHDDHHPKNGGHHDSHQNRHHDDHHKRDGHRGKSHRDHHDGHDGHHDDHHDDHHHEKRGPKHHDDHHGDKHHEDHHEPKHHDDHHGHKEHDDHHGHSSRHSHKKKKRQRDPYDPYHSYAGPERVTQRAPEPPRGHSYHPDPFRGHSYHPHDPHGFTPYGGGYPQMPMPQAYGYPPQVGFPPQPGYGFPPQPHAGYGAPHAQAQRPF